MVGLLLLKQMGSLGGNLRQLTPLGLRANFSAMVLDNARHERFAQLVSDGKSEMASFAEAGYSAKSAKQNAHRLSENEGVKARIAELQARAEANCDLTRAEVFASFALAQLDPDEPISYDAKLKAIALLSKMCGWDSPEKHEVGPNNELTELLKRLRGG
jgi:Terminase small subunit